MKHETASLLITQKILENQMNSKEFQEACLNAQDIEFIKELISPKLIVVILLKSYHYIKLFFIVFKK